MAGRVTGSRFGHGKIHFLTRENVIVSMRDLVPTKRLLEGYEYPRASLLDLSPSPSRIAVFRKGRRTPDSNHCALAHKLWSEASLRNFSTPGVDIAYKMPEIYTLFPQWTSRREHM